MLTSLRVRDLAVLEDVEVSFGEGLTVLTGETGAGKSLVVDALSLLSGDRADASLVRAGAERLVVEGAFECDQPAVASSLAEAGLGAESRDPFPFEVVVRREVAAGGKGRLFINGSPAAVKTLQDVAPRLLVLYGQAEARDLLDPAAPRERLDRFAGILEAAERTASLFSELKRLQGERDRIAGAAADRGKRLELLDFQIAEIDAVKPEKGEDERLSSEKAKMANVEKVGKLLAVAVDALESDENGAIRAVSAAQRALQALSEVDLSFSSKVLETTEAIERLREVAFAASRELSRLEADPKRIAFVAERLDGLAKLKRKYGPTLEEVLSHREAIGRGRDELTDLEGSLKKAEEAARLAFEEYRKAALELSAARAAASPRFSRAVENHLKDLAFVRASFKVEVSRRPDDDSPFVAGGERVAYGSAGIDQVGLSFAPNPGEPPRPLAKIASGGELARVQLALAAALAEEDVRAEARSKDVRNPARGGRRCGPVRTFVFDEVDAGVSGATAEAVGKKLRGLAAREQILVVTHLPQVAAAGERHLLVSKETSGGRTKTRVTPLDGRGRVEAIAAMLAGSSVGEAARAHARQLLGGFGKS